MASTQTIDSGSLTSDLSPVNDVSYERGNPTQRLKRLLSEGASRVLPSYRLEVERRPRSSTALLGSIVLSARQFEGFLERERSLADRGTRRFSLLVLRDRVDDSRQHRKNDRLTELARQLCKRLRSIDLVGRLDANRVEILLTDTEPADARIVAARVEQVEAKLGLRLDRKIYVYPSFTERATGTKRNGGPRHDDPHEGLHSTENGNGRCRANGQSRTQTNGAALATVQLATDGMDPDSVHQLTMGRDAPASKGLTAGSWPIADLWPLLSIPTPLWKRTLDILISCVAMLVLLPLFALIAIAIRLESPGPLIFRQLRAGRGARPFVFYKFRSMIVDAEQQRASLADQNEQDGPVFKIQNDPRITRVGRWLRRWSIDELPQLWNVFKGDTSLVGPRSPTLDEVCEYERWQLRRLCITGGITCFWQVSGRSQISFREWMRLDMRYIACRSLWLDLRLLVRTLPAVLSGRGAC